MKCMRCGKESKWELCRECKEVKHRAGALISQNKKKLKKPDRVKYTRAWKV